MLAFRQYSLILNNLVKAPHVDSHARLILPRLISNQSPIKLPVKTKPEPPERPKEPPSLKFLKKVQENVPPSAINILSEQWKDLDETTRRKKSEDYHMELEEYIKQVREHCIPFTGPPRKTKSEEKLTNIFAKPKKPASPYSLFVADQFKQQIIKQKFEKKLFEEFSKKWNAISEDERKKYDEKFRLAKKKWEKRLADWEEEMIRLGNEPLVRKGTLAAMKSPKKSRQRKKPAVKAATQTSSHPTLQGLISVT